MVLINTESKTTRKVLFRLIKHPFPLSFTDSPPFNWIPRNSFLRGGKDQIPLFIIDVSQNKLALGEENSVLFDTLGAFWVQFYKGGAETGGCFYMGAWFILLILKTIQVWFLFILYVELLFFFIFKYYIFVKSSLIIINEIIHFTIFFVWVNC